MHRFAIVSLFPEFAEAVAAYGVVRRGVAAGRVEVRGINPRDYTEDRHRTVDDKPYGGGPGMVMQPEPLARAISAARATTAGPVVMMSPQGEPFTQAWARRLAQAPGLVLVCGRYEGVDERLLQAEVDIELSLGDFVLSGGELAAMSVVDAVARLLPGVLGDEASAMQDSFSDGLLDHDHYTRPEKWRDQGVPEVLLSGDHAAIARWRLQRALGHTWLKRPELLDDLDLDDESTALLRAFMAGHGS